MFFIPYILVFIHIVYIFFICQDYITSLILSWTLSLLMFTPIEINCEFYLRKKISFIIVVELKLLHLLKVQPLLVKICNLEACVYFTNEYQMINLFLQWRP